MISFRNHVVSLIAVFLALAIGIVLGGGPMSAVGNGGDRPAANGDVAALDAARSQAAYADRLSARLAPQAYNDRLRNRAVVLLAMPGVSPSVRSALVDEVTRAGGSVTGQVELTDALTAPGEKALVDSLGSQLAAQNAGTVVGGSSTYDRIGQLIGRSVATDAKRPQRRTGKESTIGEGLQAADLVAIPDRLRRTAPLVVLVLGSDTSQEADPAYEGLVLGLTRAARGVVVAGTASDGDSGRLSRLRSAGSLDAVASVDGIDTTSGAVTAVLALTAWPRSTGGAYGASGADGTVPIR